VPEHPVIVEQQHRTLTAGNQLLESDDDALEHVGEPGAAGTLPIADVCRSSTAVASSPDSTVTPPIGIRWLARSSDASVDQDRRSR
jgi:hypothetical protein